MSKHSEPMLEKGYPDSTAPPFYLYEMIREQPVAVDASIRSARKQANRLRELFHGIRRIFTTGCGTSYHWALVAQHMVRQSFGGRVEAHAEQAFDLYAYPPVFREGDLVIGYSHGGLSWATRLAARKARSMGAKTLAVSGTEGSAFEGEAHAVLRTEAGVEKSFTYTKSYTSAIAAIATLFCEVGGERSASLESSLNELKVALSRTVNESEAFMKNLASKTYTFRDFYFVGSGANYATALESALKMKESHYVHAEGVQTEQLLHGPLGSLCGEEVLMVIAPSDAGLNRNITAGKAALSLGSEVVFVCDEPIDGLEDRCLVLAKLDPLLSPVTFAVPAQWYSYWLSREKGINPDVIRYDEERHWRAKVVGATEGPELPHTL